MNALLMSRWSVRQPQAPSVSCSGVAPRPVQKPITRSTKATAVVAPSRVASRSFGNGVASQQSRTASLDYIFKGDAPEGAFDFDEPSSRQAQMPEQRGGDGEGREPSALVTQGQIVNSARYTAQLRGSSRRPPGERHSSARGRPVRTGTGTGRPQHSSSRAPAGVMTAEDQAACCLAVQALARLELTRQELSEQQLARGGDARGAQLRLEAWANAAGLPSVQALLQEISAGETALRKLEASNMGLIMKSIGKMRTSGLPREDLIFEAKAGLRKAAIRFDPSRGAPLFPLASMYIRKQLNSLREQQSRPITAPVGGHEKLVKLRRIERELTKELGRPPTVEVVAAKANMDLAVAQGLLKWAQPVEDFNKLAEIGKANDHESLGAEEVLADVDEDGNVKGDAEDDLINEADLKRLRSDVDLMIGLLHDEREQQVVAMRYGLVDGRCMTFKEIGEALPEPVTANTARTLLVRAMGRLRELSSLLQPSTAFA